MALPAALIPSSQDMTQAVPGHGEFLKGQASALIFRPSPVEALVSLALSLSTSPGIQFPVLVTARTHQHEFTVGLHQEMNVVDIAKQLDRTTTGFKVLVNTHNAWNRTNSRQLLRPLQPDPKLMGVCLLPNGVHPVILLCTLVWFSGHTCTYLSCIIRCRPPAGIEDQLGSLSPSVMEIACPCFVNI